MRTGGRSAVYNGREAGPLSPLQQVWSHIGHVAPAWRKAADKGASLPAASRLPSPVQCQGQPEAEFEPARPRRLSIPPRQDRSSKIAFKRAAGDQERIHHAPISDQTAQDRARQAAGSERHLCCPLRSRHVQQRAHEAPLGRHPIDQECQLLMCITDAIRIPRDQRVTVFKNRRPIELATINRVGRTARASDHRRNPPAAFW